MTLTPHTDQCKACHEPIRWATMEETGNAMPLQPEPVAAAGALLGVRLIEGALHARILTDAAPLRADERPGRSHFADCPSANQYRSRSRSRQRSHP